MFWGQHTQYADIALDNTSCVQRDYTNQNMCKSGMQSSISGSKVDYAYPCGKLASNVHTGKARAVGRPYGRRLWLGQQKIRHMFCNLWPRSHQHTDWNCNSPCRFCPMITVTGQVPVAMISRDTFQESDIIEIKLFHNLYKHACAVAKIQRSMLTNGTCETH